jgi:hypothetical protein
MKPFLLGLTTLILFNTDVYAVPTNEQLYQMVLEMKDEQENLKKEVSVSKTRESDLQAHLDKAKAELVTAKKQVDETQKTSNVKEGFFASAGGLYVKPLIRSQSPYGALGVNSDNGLDYESGFQVSTGYQTDNSWDYILKFKRFNTNSVVPDMSATTGLQVSSPYIFGYKSNYNVLDFEIGKLFSLSDNVALRVSGGIRYAAMNENLSSSYSYSSSSGGGSYSSAPDWKVVSYTMTTTASGTSSFKHDFWGIGPRITAAPTWKPFGNNFRVFGNIGTSFLKGQQIETASANNSYSCSSTSSVVSCGGSSGNYSSSVRQDSFVTMFEAGSGMGYTIKANLVDINFQAGYQFEHWLVTDQAANILFRGFHGAYGTVGVKF